MDSLTVNYGSLLTPQNVRKLVCGWLKEDTPSFDCGGFVVGDKEERAFLLCKSPGVLCGVPFFNEVFVQLNCEVEWFFEEGTFIYPVTKVAIVKGKVKDILLGERVALNCLTRASGVATFSRQFVDIKVRNKWKGEIAGTRKTTPGFRMVEKYSLLVGGAFTHRYDLSGLVMLKDNHIWSCGNISTAVKSARSVCGFHNKIEVECRSQEEALEAIEAGADIIMLDNFSPEAAKAVSKELKQKCQSVIVEVSGGINDSNISGYMLSDVDIISVGKLTQGYDTVDFSLKIDKHGYDPRNLTVELH